jgi:SAM-dependent methyltransferase
MKQMWEERYGRDGYAYGEEPNAFDFSAAGREKAMRLADRYGVDIDYEVADYDTAHVDPGAYDAVALIFTHMHERIRRTVHRKLVSALKPGGHLFLEAYSPEQLRYGTGGPPNAQLLYTLADLQQDFSDLDVVQLENIEAEIHEGQYHTGLASVVRLVAVR